MGCKGRKSAVVFALDLEGMTRRHGGRAFRSAGAEAGAAVLAFSGARQDAVCGVREDGGQFVCGQPLALPLADHVTLL